MLSTSQITYLLTSASFASNAGGEGQAERVGNGSDLPGGTMSLEHRAIPKGGRCQYLDISNGWGSRRARENDTIVLVNLVKSDVDKTMGNIWEVDGKEAIGHGSSRSSNESSVFAVGALCKMFPGTQTSLQNTDRGCVGVARQAVPELCAVREHWKLSLHGREGACRQLFLWALRPGMVRGYFKRVKLPEELMEEIQGRGFHREVGTVAGGASPSYDRWIMDPQ
ncbi:hypothetical protein B296_00049750 [Ensete ventricosum]|uniref:Uncharacterized protein n=1 Tax=Ensete ventricosum TaxID=4639 RepID=A0A426XDZ4_ENSVE|nr:hypothetical protein B296_00049750 [Ensete ventricosum]